MKNSEAASILIDMKYSRTPTVREFVRHQIILHFKRYVKFPVTYESLFHHEYNFYSRFRIDCEIFNPEFVLHVAHECRCQLYYLHLKCLAHNVDYNSLVYVQHNK